jgi:hypothetical protein
MIEMQERSGQSVKAFCRERGLGEASFYGWRKRLRPGSVKFALVEPKSGTNNSAVELVLTSGERIRFAADEAILRMVVSVLREQP